MRLSAVQFVQDTLKALLGAHINHQLNLVENDSLIPAALNQVP